MVRVLATLIASLILTAVHAWAEPTATPPPEKRYIRKITIKVGEVFEDGTESAYALVNNIKTSTDGAVIRRELLFREGDTFDPYLIKQTARNLRLQKFLRAIKITPTFDGDAVDVVVEARDSWTLIPYLS